MALELDTNMDTDTQTIPTKPKRQLKVSLSQDIQPETAVTIIPCVESVLLAQPVQFHGQMRTYFNASDGFAIERTQFGTFTIRHPAVTNKYLEISFTNISCIRWAMKS